MVRIAVIGVERGPLTVCDRVAEGYDDACPLGCSNFHALQKEVALCGGRCRQQWLSDVVSDRRNICCPKTDAMPGNWSSAPRQVNVDSEGACRRNLQPHRIASDVSIRNDGDRRLPSER